MEGFLSTLPARGATVVVVDEVGLFGISIHAPREGSDVFLSQALVDILISIHAPREGSDVVRRTYTVIRGKFLSTLPARGATLAPPVCLGNGVFLSTLPARGATQRRRVRPMTIEISIHAPREGSDNQDVTSGACTADFYPRSPRGERPRYLIQCIGAERFLSTLPARGATRHGCDSLRKNSEFLSTLPARGATLATPEQRRTQHDFYPRSPRGERQEALDRQRETDEFLSTLPARGATSDRGPRQNGRAISIHAPREGSDNRWGFFVYLKRISIHAPREGSDYRLSPTATPTASFLSTLPARGATKITLGRIMFHVISIHAPREGSDCRGG